MKIRECREEDWGQIWYLLKVSGLALPPGCILSRSERCHAKTGLSLVADSGGAVVGSIIGTWDGERGWICSMTVDPRLRRMGIGRQLLQEFSDKLKEKGAVYLITLVPVNSLEAQTVFEALDFQTISGHIIMGKPLS